MRIHVREGNLAAYDGDAVVNAANNHLVLGAGVAGAIRRSGGPRIQEECDAYIARHGPIRVGAAVATAGGALRARWVIHAAAMGDEPASERSIAEATAAALQVAEELGVRTVAFPVLGSGVAGFPFRRAAELMLAAVRAHAARAALPEDVVFFGYTAGDAATLRQLVGS